MRRKNLAIRAGLFVLVFGLSACDGDGPAAYGNFEADDVTVSAEIAGRLDRFDLDEGRVLAAGTVVAQIDTTQLGLQRQELVQQRVGAEVRAEQARAQVEVLRAQLRTAKDDLARTHRLFGDQAATASELNRLQGNVDALERQITAARAGVRLAEQEAVTVEARIHQVDDRIDRGSVRNPVAGTVLTTFAERGEFVQPGRPLYAIAALDTLTLRVYLSGGQLASVHLGDTVPVGFDDAGGSIGRTDGRVTWIASSAEFTPTPIQTRDERVDQVYAVKIRVPNPDGTLKIGMPGELLETVGHAAGAGR